MSRTSQKKRSRTRKQSRPRFRLAELMYQGKSDYFDYNLLAVILLLTCFGLIMLYSTSSFSAEQAYGDDMHFFKRQAMISAFCILMAVVISKMDYHVLGRFSTVIYGAAAVMMALVKSPLGSASHGAKRWLGRGAFRFQPAEIAKIAVIVCLSYMIVQMGKNVVTLKAGMTLGAMGGFLALCAYKLTDNLSTGLIIMGIAVGMIFISRPSIRNTVIFAVVAVIVLIIAIQILKSVMANVEITEDTPFRIRRILVWLQPEKYSKGDGYQTLQALYAIGSGGIFGRGLGNSIQKLGSVPEAQNDFIFSIICEELGILGGMIVLLFFGYMLYRLFFIAQNAPDLFGSLLVSGVFIHIALQVLLNVAVVLNLLPNTGVTLPFISYGGTSVLFLMTELGIALSVSRQIKFRDTAPLL